MTVDAPTVGKPAPALTPVAVAVDELTLLSGNPRRGDVPAIAASLEAFGQRKPVVARRADRTVIAGNHTLQAARSLGWETIAVVWVDDDDTMAKAYALADNRTAELGGYDDAELAALIAEVGEADASLLAATAWTPEDVAKLIADLDMPSGFSPLDAPDVRLDKKAPITCPECGHQWTN